MVAIAIPRKIVGWSTIAGAFALAMVGTTFALASTGDVDAEAVEIIPDADEQLTQSELRWCIFESARLDGEIEELDARIVWEVENYNVRSRAYQEHCSDRKYSEGDKSAVEDELTPAKRLSLREQGVARVMDARAERENRRVHVKEHVARVLAAPEHAAEELGSVAQWGDLVATGREQGPWHEVEWPAAASGEMPAAGWVLGGLLGRGAGTDGRFAYCEQRAGDRATHNDVVRRDIDLHTISSFTVENGLEDNAYVKLVREQDSAVVSLFVAAKQTASLIGLPSGSYEIVFATGSNFSRGCDSFSQRGTAQRFPNRIDYGHRAVVWTLSLESEEDGNARADSISYDEFDRL
ncbi:MAG: hypothetical protein OXP75_12340 [Rhodospirillales bacterium]|nr:hypothetical protein [Rhodospirillales bacterium]